MKSGWRASFCWLAVCLLLAGCSGQIAGTGAPDFEAAGPKTFKVAFGQLEVTPLALFRTKAVASGADALRIQLKVRNPGSTVVRIFAGGECLVDDQGRKQLNDAGEQTDSPAGDPAQPAFPGSFSLAPGESVLGFMTFLTDPGFTPTAFQYQPDVEWPLAGIPRRQPTTETAQVPAEAYPVKKQLALRGIDQNGEPNGFVRQDVRARLERLVDPAQGRSAGAGYRLVAVEMTIGNLGTNRYNAVPTAAMNLFDSQGYAYDPVAYVDSGQFPSGELGPRQIASGLVGFLVPKQAKLAYVGLYLSQGDEEAAARWKLA